MNVRRSQVVRLILLTIVVASVVAAIVSEVTLRVVILTMRVHSSFTTVLSTSSAWARFYIALIHHAATGMIVSIVRMLVVEIRVVVVSIFIYSVASDLVIRAWLVLLLLALIGVKLRLVPGVA